MGRQKMRRQTKMLGIMLTDRERERLVELAAEAEMSMSEYVRDLIRQADRDRSRLILDTFKAKKAKRELEYAQ